MKDTCAICNEEWPEAWNFCGCGNMPAGYESRFLADSSDEESVERDRVFLDRSERYNEVKVTDRMFTLGPTAYTIRRYQISKIERARKVVDRGMSIWRLSLFVAAGLVAVIGVVLSLNYLVLAAGIVMVVVFSGKIRNDTYRVVLEDKLGSETVYYSKYEDYADEIIRALTAAKAVKREWAPKI